MPINDSKLPPSEGAGIFDWANKPVVDLLPSGVKDTLEANAQPSLSDATTQPNTAERLAKATLGHIPYVGNAIAEGLPLSMAKLKGFGTGAAEAVTPNWLASIPALLATGPIGIAANAITGAEGAYEAKKGYDEGNKAKMLGGALNAIGSGMGAAHAYFGIKAPEAPTSTEYTIEPTNRGEAPLAGNHGKPMGKLPNPKVKISDTPIPTVPDTRTPDEIAADMQRVQEKIAYPGNPKEPSKAVAKQLPKLEEQFSNADARANVKAYDVRQQQLAAQGRAATKDTAAATKQAAATDRVWAQEAKNENVRQDYLENQAAQAAIDAKKAGLKPQPPTVTETTRATGPNGEANTATVRHTPPTPEGVEEGAAGPVEVPKNQFDTKGRPTFIAGNKTQAIKAGQKFDASLYEKTNGGYKLHYADSQAPPEVPPTTPPTTPKPPSIKPSPVQKFDQAVQANLTKAGKLADSQGGVDKLDQLQQAISGTEEPPTKGNGTLPSNPPEPIVTPAKAPTVAPTPSTPVNPRVAALQDLQDQGQKKIADAMAKAAARPPDPKWANIEAVINKVKGGEAPAAPEVPTTPEPTMAQQIAAQAELKKQQIGQLNKQAEGAAFEADPALSEAQERLGITRGGAAGKPGGGIVAEPRKGLVIMRPEGNEGWQKSEFDQTGAPPPAPKTPNPPKLPETPIAEATPQPTGEPVRPAEPTTTPTTDTLGQTSKAREAALAKRQAAQQAAQGVQDQTAQGMQEDLSNLEKMSPEERKSLIDKWKGQGGSASFEPLLRMAMGATGGYVGAREDPLHNKVASGLAGAGLAAFLPQIIRGGVDLAGKVPESQERISSALGNLNTIHNAGLLSPLSVAKKAMGDVGGLAAGALQNPNRAGAILKALMNREALVNDFKTGYNTANEANSGLDNLVQAKNIGNTNIPNPMAVSGRTMGGLTAATKGTLARAGFSPEEQELLTFTNKPTTGLGEDVLSAVQRNKLLQHVAPFARIGINRAERGFENSPLGLLSLLTSAGDKPAAQKILTNSLAGSGIAAGAYNLTPEHFFKDHPTEAGLISALAGPYGLPVAFAMAAKGSKNQPMSAGMKETTRDLPGFRFIEDIQSPEAYGRNYLSGYTNVTRPIAEGIADARGEAKPDIKSKKLNPVQRQVNQALSNVPGVRETLPTKGGK